MHLQVLDDDTPSVIAGSRRREDGRNARRNVTPWSVAPRRQSPTRYTRAAPALSLKWESRISRGVPAAGRVSRILRRTSPRLASSGLTKRVELSGRFRQTPPNAVA